MVVMILPECIEDKVQTTLRSLKITDKEGDKHFRYIFPYCKKCKSYLTEEGKTKSPLEAARDLYAQNPHLGKPKDIVKATYMPNR